ncbi:MAG TPA: TolC family protein [Steroidobacteraceae bacterium]
MFHNWQSLAGASALALLLTLTRAQGAEQSAPGDLKSSQTPLGADSFTDAVLAHNASLEAMRQAVLAAVAQISPAGALEDPMLSVSSAPRTFGSAMGPAGDIEVSQALPWWGTLDARTQVARTEAEAANHDLDSLRLRLTATARGAFADWVFVYHALEINAANQSVLADLRDIAKVRYTTGQAPQQDVLQADVERALLKQQRLELERDRTTVQARMNALLDLSPQAPMAPPAELPATITVPAEELLADRALTSHPQLAQLQAKEDTAEAQVQLQEKERYPKFRLSAGYNNMWSDPAMRPMVGVSITVPIDQGKYRAAIEAARAQAHRAASTLKDQRASVLADLAADYASLHETVQSLALYRDELVPLARATLQVARTDYASGRSDFLNVMTAEKHQLDTELGLARLKSEYYRRLAELDRASGGGLLSPSSPVEGGMTHEETDR